MKYSGAFVVAAQIVLGGSWTCFAAETFKSLVARIPADANALVLIDVEQTLAAPLARAQGWARKLEAAYVERPVFLPPEAKKLVIGASLQPSNDFLGKWELAVMELAEPVGVRSIARSEAGYVDEMSGTPTAVTPLNTVFVDLGDGLLAVMRPAERQVASRWIARQRQGAISDLSEYLQDAIPQVNDRVQVLLAVDLTDVLGPHEIEGKLANAPWMADKKTDSASVAAVAKKLRGAVLRLAIGEECQGQLKIDFDADVAPLGKVAKPLVLQALASIGFPTDEVSNWDFTADGRSIRLQGVLSTDAQRRVFSVIELPQADMKAGETAGAAGSQAGESEVRESSIAYFKSAQTLVADLRKSLKDSRATTAWIERYARRIDELPVLNVDEELLDYGDKLSETLRIMALSQRQAGIRAGVRATEGRGYYYSDGYGTDAYTAAAQRSQAKKEEMSVAYDTRVQGWQLIDDATADIRRAMTKKYGVEF